MTNLILQNGYNALEFKVFEFSDPVLDEVELFVWIVILWDILWLVAKTAPEKMIDSI